MGQAEKAALFDSFAHVGKAISSGRRVEILDVLANGERSVERLAEETHLSIANVSQHLRALRAAGLVTSHREGSFVFYRLSSPSVFELYRSIRSLAAERLAEVERLTDAFIRHRDRLEPLSRKELERRLRDHEDLFVLDVRPREEFEAGHVPGAVSIPIAELRRRLKEVPKEREIVAYCRGPYCVMAHDAVAFLRPRGYRVRRLEDGLPEWVAAGLPTEAGR